LLSVPKYLDEKIKKNLKNKIPYDPREGKFIAGEGRCNNYIDNAFITITILYNDFHDRIKNIVGK